MMQIDGSVPSELGPLSWLVGLWEGTGVMHYTIGDDVHELEFGQRLTFTHDGLPWLNYQSYSWNLATGEAHVTETGYWRLSRAAQPGDPGPGMLPGTGEAPYPTAESVESLRNAAGGFDLEVSILHPTGVSELYLGQVKDGRIDLGTDAVMRSATAKEYTAATRLYGLVEGRLLWAWDVAALGQDLRTHASGSLDRVE